MGIFYYVAVACVGLVFNTIAIWIVVNYLMGEEHSGTFGQCFLCVFYMSLICIVCSIVLFIPIPVINIALYLYLIFKGCVAAIEGVFETVEGGIAILILYIIVNAVINFVGSAMFG